MSQVTKGLLGFGVLGPLQSQTWVTNVEPGRVWHFWVDNTTLAYYPTRVRIAFVDTLRHANLLRAEIRVSNTSPFYTTGFALRWSMVYN